MRILITGAIGFIGYHLCSSLLKQGYEVFGIDNINDYYDQKLKLSRLKGLKSYNKFIFKKVDISDRKSLKKIFMNFKPFKVVNLAAQAGVRYSIENPYTYAESNLLGFINIIQFCSDFNTEGLIYASSSSVYGGNKKFPFSEEDRVDHPLALYGATKRANELIAHSYSNIYGLNTTGLRFFTVYGPWGRPDMAIYIFTRKINNNEPIEVYNNGDMQRDFTYIDDIVDGIIGAIKKNLHCEIFNLGNHKSEKLMDIIGLIEKELNKKAIIEFKPLQPGDVKKSFAKITKSQQMIGFNPKINIDRGIPRFIKWYQDYYKLN